jgi:superfamily II DNA helicase RecQ
MFCNFVFIYIIYMQVDSERHAITLVVSPLKALMADQVNMLREHGVKAGCILRKENMSAEEVDGNCFKINNVPS